MRVSRNRGFEIRLLRASKSRAQIAGLTLVRRCQRAILFEGSRVARRQEAGTQLLERAVTTITDTVGYINMPCAVARRAEAAELRRNRRAVD